MEDISSIVKADISFIPPSAELWENSAVQKPIEILRQRIAERLAAMRISPRALSLSIGASHSYVSQILSGKGGMPSADRLLRLAEELHTTVDYLTGRASNPAQVHSEVGLSDKRIEWNGPRSNNGTMPTNAPAPIPVVGTGDCASLTIRSDHGDMIEIERSSFDPDFHVRYIARPPALAGARDLYAIYFHGDSMSPRYEAGEVGIVDPRRPVAAGDYVVVQMRDDGADDVVAVMVKRLVRQTAAGYTLEQFNPPAQFDLPRARVVRMHRIVPNTELLF